MKKILSIDFDYFVNATAKQREELFPNGADEVDPDTLSKMWEKAYREDDGEILSLGVIKDYDFMKEYLIGKKVYLADSHKEIKKVIDLVPKEERIVILNVDFHHDYYHYFSNSNEYNCGNWLRRLTEDRTNTSVAWVRREDSQVLSLEGELPFPHGSDLKDTLTRFMPTEFDYIFLCLSPEWTPPHLYSLYDKLKGGN